MIGLVITTHGTLGQALLDACTMIIGPQQQVCTVSIERSRSPESAREELQAAVAMAGQDRDGVLIMADMFGGTPANLGAALLADGQVEVLCGVNLPMVLKFFSSREGRTLDELGPLLKGYGQQGILLVGELLQAHAAE